LREPDLIQAPRWAPSSPSSGLVGNCMPGIDGPNYGAQAGTAGGTRACVRALSLHFTRHSG